MKNLYCCLVVLMGALVAGCNQGTPGGPGAGTESHDKSEVVQADDSFNLSASLIPTTIKQGERIETSIGIKRGKNFDQDVSLKFDGLPTGVKMEPSEPTIKHGEEDAKMSIEAKDDAALGDYNVTVTGHPSSGADAAISFKLKVDKK